MSIWIAGAAAFLASLAAIASFYFDHLQPADVASARTVITNLEQGQRLTNPYQFSGLVATTDREAGKTSVLLVYTHGPNTFVIDYVPQNAPKWTLRPDLAKFAKPGETIGPIQVGLLRANPAAAASLLAKKAARISTSADKRWPGFTASELTGTALITKVDNIYISIPVNRPS